MSFGAETKHISNKSQKQDAAHQRETVLFSKRRIGSFLSATILRPNLYHRQEAALGLCGESREVTKQPLRCLWGPVVRMKPMQLPESQPRDQEALVKDLPSAGHLWTPLRVLGQVNGRNHHFSKIRTLVFSN